MYKCYNKYIQREVLTMMKKNHEAYYVAMALAKLSYDEFVELPLRREEICIIKQHIGLP